MAQITQNTVSDYDVGYILSSFRRNRREFTGSSASVIDRYVLPIRQLLDEYVFGIITGSLPETGPGSREDYAEAINIGLQFFVKILNTPEPGNYTLDPKTGVYVEGTAAEGTKGLTIGTNVGKYLKPEIQTVGVEEQVMRRGAELDKAAVLMALAMRGFPARKYAQAGLAVNYFDIAKELSLDLFSKAIRGSGEATFPAIETEGTLVALTSAQAASLPQGAPVQQIKVKPSTSLMIETYAMIFAMSDYNNAGDRSFEDYIDFRIVGDDDRSLPDGVKTIAFTSANGLRRIVVPQTADGKSISFAIAKGADEKSAELEALLKVVENPLIKTAESKLVELLFDKVLAGYGVLYQTLQGQPLPTAVAEQLTADKTAGIKRILEVFADVQGQIATVREQAVQSGDEETIKQMDAFLAVLSSENQKFVCDEEIVIGAEGETKVTVPCSAESFGKLGSQAEGSQDKIDDLRRELRGIEADLLHMRQLYRSLNQ
jgi:hypothetical protein